MGEISGVVNGHEECDERPAQTGPRSCGCGWNLVSRQSGGPLNASTRRSSTCFLVAAMLVSVFAPAASPSPEQETMSQLRAIAGALLSRYEDEVSGENRMGAPANDWILASQPSDLIRVPDVRALRSRKGVLGLLRPGADFIYLCDVPDRDAWGERIEVYYEQDKILSARFLTVRSAGANRRFDADRYEVGGFLPGAAIDDIVVADHRFVRWPLGVPEADLRVEPKIGRCPGFDDGSGPGVTPAP